MTHDPGPAPSTQETTHVHFLLIGNFSLISFSSAIEPLRIANKVQMHKAFTYHCVSMDGEPVVASNGLPIHADMPLAGVGKSDLIVVCSSDNVESIDVPDEAGAHLRRLERHGTRLAAICTGSYLLAKLGLLRERSCTIHWEYRDTFIELFPAARLRDTIVVDDQGLLTSSGGTAPLDMMMQFVTSKVGNRVARSIADIAIHHNFRDQSVSQRLDLRQRLNVPVPALIQCVELMETNIEAPLSSQQLALLVGLSLRQLQRHFKQHIGSGLHAHYLDIRLNRAHDLITRTSMPTIAIATATGFNSAEHFSSAYRAKYGVSPFLNRRARPRRQDTGHG